ncbi:MAG: prolyl oligopeptidase family serine peptidase [Planctomycetota bacterium]
MTIKRTCRVALAALLAMTAGAASGDEMTTTFTGEQISRWRVQTVDDRPGRLSPMITADGDELNHHRVTVAWTGDGAVWVSVAHSRNEQWDRAIDKKHLHSRWRKATRGEAVKVVSPNRGERFAWILLRTEGDVTIERVTHTCYRGEGTLYGHRPMEYTFAGRTLPFRIMLPRNYDPNRTYPLVLSVAGSGSIGTKNQKNMEKCILARHLFTQYYDREEFDCFSLVPQIPPRQFVPAPYHPAGPRGAPTRWHPDWPAVNAEGWFTQATLALVRELVSNPKLHIDPDRVYFTGFSYGGKACWEFLKAAPDLFAGAIAGGGWAIGPAYSTPSGAAADQLAEEVATYAHVPVLIFAGEKDRMASSSRAIHRQIQAADGTSRYVEIPGAGHLPSASRGWGDPDHIRWLFRQRRRSTTLDDEATPASRPAP